MNIYYSRSNEVDDAQIDPLLTSLVETIRIVKRVETTLTCHKRGSQYDPGKVINADMVVVGVSDIMDPDPKIGKGCYDEIILALKHNIPVFFFHTLANFTYLELIKKGELGVIDPYNWRYGYAEIYGFTRSSIGVYEGNKLARLGDYKAMFEMFDNVGLEIDNFPAKVSPEYEETASDDDDELLLLSLLG